MAINTNEITKQVIDFQKNAFNSWYDAVTIMQDQAVSVVDTALTQSGLAPGDNTKAVDKWVEVFKSNRQSLKKQVDSNFKQAEKLLIV